MYELNEYEYSITTKYRYKLWSKFVKACKEYELIKPGDRILVCISGGKDSMLMAKLFQQLLRHSDFDFEAKYVVMNPGYNEKNLTLIKENLNKLNIPAEIIATNIFEIANKQVKSPCFLCAKMRRGALYNIAQKMNCNKISLGHHYDDVIETTLMNLLNAGSFQTMLPKLHSTNFPGLELIRPMYCIREKDIIGWKNYHHLEFLECACKFTEENKKAYDEIGSSKREETKRLIHALLKYNPQVEKNIFISTTNVVLEKVLGYKIGDQKITFLDHYDDKNDDDE